MANTRKAPHAPDDEAVADAAEQAERLSRSLSGTAQQIWLAGLGAFARAQAESTKLFEGLVKEGLSLEQSALKFADTQADVVRDVIESGVDTATARAAGTWGQLETAVEGGVRRALTRLGVPDRETIAELGRRVDSLSAELRKRNGGQASAAAAPRKPAARKAGNRTSTAASADAPSPTRPTRPTRPTKAIKAIKATKATKATKAPGKKTRKSATRVQK